MPDYWGIDLDYYERYYSYLTNCSYWGNCTANTTTNSSAYSNETSQLREELSAVEETTKDILGISLNITRHLANHTEQFIGEVKQEIDSAGYNSSFVDDVAFDAIESFTEPIYAMNETLSGVSDLVEEID